MKEYAGKLQAQQRNGRTEAEPCEILKKWVPILSEKNGRFYVSGFGLQKSS
jgi:hypothetical protein